MDKRVNGSKLNTFFFLGIILRTLLRIYKPLNSLLLKMPRPSHIATTKARLAVLREELPPTPVSMQKKDHNEKPDTMRKEVDSDDENEAEIDPFSEYNNISPTSSSGALLTPPISPLANDKENEEPIPDAPAWNASEEATDDEDDFATLRDDYTTDNDGGAFEEFVASRAIVKSIFERGYESLWLGYRDMEIFQTTTLAAFLDERKAGPNDPTTHTSYTGGKWSIPMVENNLFLALLSRLYMRGISAVHIRASTAVEKIPFYHRLGHGRGTI